MSQAKRAIGNCLLAFASLAVGLALCEATLRLFHPRYEYAAAPPQRTYHWSSQYRHPDTGEPHLVVYNNLGSRQHRDFHQRELAEGVNLAFFGDSFTENLRMAAQYSFTEVLDYLLNAQPRRGPSSSPARTAPRAGRFNVLNFGMDARGPVEQYWRYRGLGFKRLLRHVFYVHSRADIHRLRGWRGGGRLAGQARQARQAGQEGVSTLVRVLRGLHLTYLGLDVWHRIGGTDPASGYFGAMSKPMALAALDALLRRWRREVEANGGAFHIVLLPSAEILL